LTAFVRETDASNVSVGQDIAFSVLAASGRTFRARINYVASAFDPATRRLLVRATVENKDGVLKPEMFANVTLYSNGDLSRVDTLGIPRSAVIYEGDVSRVWVARDDQSIELRQVRLGLTNDKMIQVLAGVRVGERVVSRGSLFIDRAATGS
jgi:cobalt-zinc-cadmium efflux system membrane fusion protein